MTVDEILRRIPSNTFKIPIVRSILIRVLPVVKDVTPIIPCIEILKSPSYEPAFMDFLIKFVGELFALLNLPNIALLKAKAVPIVTILLL